MEAVLIDDALTMMGPGGPPEAYAQFGEVQGQWSLVPPGHLLSDHAEIAGLAADPGRLLESVFSDLGIVLSPADIEEAIFLWEGAETVGGIPTDEYEYAGPLATYRWWIGQEAGRSHQIVSETDDQVTSMRLEYLAELTIERPIPWAQGPLFRGKEDDDVDASDQSDSPREPPPVPGGGPRSRRHRLRPDRDGDRAGPGRRFVARPA